MFADSARDREGSPSGGGRRLLPDLVSATLAFLASVVLLGTSSALAGEWATSTAFSAPTSVTPSGGGGVHLPGSGDDRIAKLDRAGLRQRVAARRGGRPSARPQVLITKVRLFPGRGWIYADGYLDMQVQVTNRGDGIARRIPLYLTSSRKRRVKVPRVVRIQQILPGWTVTRTFRVRAERSARGWVMIQADSVGRRNRSFLKLIRPWW